MTRSVADSWRLDSFRHAAATALVAGSIGCLRQTVMPIAEPAQNPGARRLAEEVGTDIEETTRPGAVFLSGGEPFCFAGTNNYYLIFASHKMVDDVLEAAKRLDLKVVRMWGMLDRGSLDGTVPNVDGKGEKDGVYFQYWDVVRKRPAYHDGKTGLETFDYALDKAHKLGLKVIPVFVNNWKDFGGMDQYVVWFGLKQHDQFYTDPRAVGAYKDYVAHIVNRQNSINGILYKEDPTIFAWELANEPRCTGSGGFNGPGCTTKTIVKWADHVSAYVKSIDPNHLVAVGDEGFFATGTAPGYDGSEGVDHDALLALDHIDFGTFHYYPETWGHPLRAAEQWIEDHIEAARKAGKPTLLEEYGLSVRRNDRGEITDAARRYELYPRWHDLLWKRGASGALSWMLAASDDVHGRYPDYDHFTVYEGEPTGELVKTFASKMQSTATACRLHRELRPATEVSRTPFVTVSRTGLSRTQ